MPAFDYKKEYKELYLPKSKPVIIDVPTMRFIMIDGKGDPTRLNSIKPQLRFCTVYPIPSK